MKDLKMKITFLYSAIFFNSLFFIFLISGCNFAGGGGSIHTPPEYIESGKTTRLELELSVWGAGSTNVTKRYTKVTCHFKITGKDKFTDLPMTVSETMKSKAIYECLLPAFSIKDGNSVEYYFDMYLDGHYNKDPNFTIVPIIDKSRDPNNKEQK
jgi:hypothetical protein